MGMMVICLDWIQDATLERNRRLRSFAQLHGSRTRGPSEDLTLAWIWKQLRKAIISGQSWLVVSLAGNVENISTCIVTGSSHFSVA